MEAPVTEIDQIEISRPIRSKERLDAVQRITARVSGADIETVHLQALLPALFDLYPRVSERRSLNTIGQCFAAVLAQNPEFVTPAIKLLARDSKTSSPSTQIVILQLAVVVARHITLEVWQKDSEKFLSIAAKALDTVLASEPRQSVVIRVGRHGRQIFSRLFGSPLSVLPSSELEKAIEFYVKDTPLRHVAALGAIASTGKLTEQAHDQYLAVFKEMAGARKAVPTYMVKSLSPFFAQLPYTKVEGAVVAVFEKGLLRSPEVILAGLLQHTVGSVDPTFDLSAVLVQRLLKPLLAASKSADSTVRLGSISALGSLLTRSKDTFAIENALNEIVTPMKTGRVASVDQRVAFAKMALFSPPLGVFSAKTTEELAAIAAKETTEAVLKAELDALVCHASACFHAGIGLSRECQAAVLAACQEKRNGWLWIDAVGRIVADCIAKCELASDFAAAFLDAMSQVWKEATSEAATANQSSAAFVIVTVLLVSSDDPTRRSEFQLVEKLSVEGPSGFLLGSRVLGNITDAGRETHLNALLSCGKIVTTLSEPAQKMWCDAILYHACSTSNPRLRKRAIAVARLVWQDVPMVGQAMISALWIWLSDLKTARRQSIALAAGSEHTALRFVLEAVFGSGVGKEVVEQQLVAALVLAQPSVLPGASWVQLCLRCKVDPHDLVSRHLDRLFDEITLCESRHQAGSDRWDELIEAVASAAADLTFVAPDIVFPRWIKQVVADLEISGLQIGETEIGIFRTPDGQIFAKLTGGDDTVVDKREKDYDTLAWEREVRLSVAKKRGEETKLSAEDRAQMAAVLQRERGVRATMRAVRQRLIRAVFFIKSLLGSPMVEFGRWVGTVVPALVRVLKWDQHGLLESHGIEAYLACSACVTDRLSNVHRPIGLATIRAEDVAVSASLAAEPLGDLVTRVLYRLRMSSEQYPLDYVSLAYTLDLVLQVVRTGGVGVKDLDEMDEQTVLAVEFLSLHAVQAADRSLPRREILAVLVNGLAGTTTHFKLLRECLLSYVRAVSADISADETDVLLAAVVNSPSAVRAIVLAGIDADLDLGTEYREHIWLACHFDEPEQRRLATEIMQESGFQVPSTAVVGLVAQLDGPVRGAAAKALGSSVAIHPALVVDLVDTLKNKYVAAVPLESTRLRRGPAVDLWECRSGVAVALAELAPVLQSDQVVPLVKFLIDSGALQDPNVDVRDRMIAAGCAVIQHQGQTQTDALFSLLEGQLDGDGSLAQDTVREAAVMLYGVLATVLPAGDERLESVTARLIDTLGTPSESVQAAIANCLPVLVQKNGSAVSGYVATLENMVVRGSKYGVQRGGAYGLAAVVRGSGIAAIAKFGLVDVLSAAAADRKDGKGRQGAFLAYELLASVVGRAAEPYLLETVPDLLAGFGDSNPEVRAACLDAAKALFGQLSSYGVKVILPTILAGLDEPQWRSKKGACELLGAMAFLDPRQLADRLADIIPALTTVLADSHKEVRSAAIRSLARFGDVVRNPEIHAVVDDLLAALADPTGKTELALDRLLRVQFVHYLDPPSLAVVARILDRGLAGRSATKQKAGQIIASLAHLADRADLICHLPTLVAGLRAAAVDPVPATRATASKALGTLVEKLGEDALPDLIPSLLAVLRGDGPSGDRLGSAQALSEVLAGLGTGRLEETMPGVLQGVRSSNPAVREGFMSLLVFLPACFGSAFAAYLGRMIPAILAGLADEVEPIRETALRAARLLVKNFAAKAVDLFLPELESGLSDDNYRIRLSSAELVGDLLYNLIGLSARADDNDDAEADDGLADRADGSTLLAVLGPDRRNRILAALYVCRSDSSPLVRSTAVTIWKTVVSSARMVRELVPAVSRLVVRRLSSPSEEQQAIAAAALGELVRKAGEGVLAVILPTFEAGLTAADPDSRRGICLGLGELVGAVAPDELAPYYPLVFSIVQAGLVDVDQDVRLCAADTFDALQTLVGRRAIDRVLPDLLAKLHADDGPDALRGLLTLLTDSDRANQIIPAVVPALLRPPMTPFNGRALAALSSAAPSALASRFGVMVNAFVTAIASASRPTETDVSSDSAVLDQLRAAFDEVISAMAEAEQDVTLNSVLALAKHDDQFRRAEGCRRLAALISSGADLNRYESEIVHGLISRFDDSDDVVAAASIGLNEFTKSLPKARLDRLVGPSREALLLVGTAGSVLPGFREPAGPGAILPIFIHGLTTGPADMRAEAALALSDLISRADGATLRPAAVQLTGALIRVVSDRAAEVRAAVMLALFNLLSTAPALVRSFLPQLQRAFAKALSDPSEIIRSRAADSLGLLVSHTARVDPLAVELVTGAKAATDPLVQATILKALFDVVKTAGSSLGQAAKSAVVSLVSASDLEGPIALVVRRVQLAAVLIKILQPDEAMRVWTANISPGSVGGIVFVNAVLVECPTAFMSFAAEGVDLVVSGVSTHTNEPLCLHALLAAGKMLLQSGAETPDGLTLSNEHQNRLVDAISVAVKPEHVGPIRRLGLTVIRAVAGRQADNSRSILTEDQRGLLIPAVFESVRDRNMPVKLSAEAAFVAVLDAVHGGDKVFSRWLSSKNAESVDAATKRSMDEYFKRVTIRLASLERERIEADGGVLGLGREESELWKVWLG